MNSRKDSYLFTSDRLGFRPWRKSDIEWYAEMNATEKVMEFFPSVMSKEESLISMQKLTEAYRDLGHTYYVTELLDTYYQDKSSFNQCDEKNWYEALQRFSTSRIR